MTMVDRVAVVGGGAIGLQAAIALADRDIAVTVFEADELGSGASGRAAGICYDAYVDRRDAEIATASIRYFREHDLLTECPYLWFAREDDDTAEAIVSQATRMADHGRDVEIVDRAAIADRFPTLISEDIETAAVAHNAGYVDAETYVDHLETRAQDVGVSIRTDAPATLTRNGSARVGRTVINSDAVLVAAGAGAIELVSNLDCSLALGLYRTQALEARSVDGDIPIYYDASTERYARPTADGVLAGDGSEMYHGEPAEYERNADDAFVSERLDELGGRLRDELTVERSWAGLCTATPDRDPLLGELEPGVFVATGLCGHGLMRSPALGRAVTEQILGADPISGFDPNRFDGDQEVSLPLSVTD